MRVIFHRGWFRSSVGVTGNPGYSTTERHPYRSEGNSMYASDDKKFHIQKFFFADCVSGTPGAADIYILPGPGGYLAAGLQKIRVRLYYWKK